MRSRTPALAVLASLMFAMSMAPAEATGPLVLEATFSSPAHGWAKVERWRDDNPGYIAAQYPSDGRIDHTGQSWIHFGNTGKPASNKYLLSYAPGWDTNPKATPVLLVPGAYETADYAWANPASSPLGCGNASCPTTGLMQSLSGSGYKVFALTFPHIVGNNYNHAEQIGDAIATIKATTGATQVDLVAWSMGTVAARMYTSGVRQSWGTAYAGDVRKLILVGGPNNGWDWTFRHGTWPSIGAYSECGGGSIGGVSALWQNCYGVLYSHPELTAYVTSAGDFFPGIRQMLKRWDSTYPLSTVADADAWANYNGGWGYYSYSHGIDYAINQGSVISSIRAAGVPSTVSTYLLCGNSADIPSPWHNEHAGPSDGTIFTASCSDTGGIGNVAGTTVINTVNHLELPWASAPDNQIQTWLN